MNRKLRDERDESDLRRVRPGPAHMIRPPTFVPVSRVSAARNPHSQQPSFASYPLLYRLPVHGHVIHPSQSPYTTRSDHASPAVNHVSTPPRHAPSAVYQLSPTVNGPGAVHVGYRAKATSSMTSDKNAGIATSFSADSACLAKKMNWPRWTRKKRHDHVRVRNLKIFSIGRPRYYALRSTIAG